jgi:hypothetical protein
MQGADAVSNTITQKNLSGMAGKIFVKTKKGRPFQGGPGMLCGYSRILLFTSSTFVLVSRSCM